MQNFSTISYSTGLLRMRRACSQQASGQIFSSVMTTEQLYTYYSLTKSRLSTVESPWSNISKQLFAGLPFFMQKRFSIYNIWSLLPQENGSEKYFTVGL